MCELAFGMVGAKCPYNISAFFAAGGTVWFECWMQTKATGAYNVKKLDKKRKTKVSSDIKNLKDCILNQKYQLSKFNEHPI